MRLAQKFLIPIILIILVSCGTPPATPDANLLYKKDVKFWVNGKKIRGVGVAPVAKSYDIYIEYLAGKIDILELSGCSRQELVYNEGTSARYTYSPNSIEVEKNCPLDIGIYDKKGRHGWGYLLFESPLFKLQATVECNGEALLANGVSICQSKIGTIQRISFGHHVEVVTDKCPITRNGNVFTYVIGREYCGYKFIDDDNNVHRHLTYGFETFINRD